LAQCPEGGAAKLFSPARPEKRPYIHPLGDIYIRGGMIPSLFAENIKDLQEIGNPYGI
jgi:hypothetical protein